MGQLKPPYWAKSGCQNHVLLISDKSWRSTAVLQSKRNDNWFMPTFDDASWHSVESLGPVESNADLFQWSADAGMYRWPGYMGMSPALRTFPLTAVAVTHVFMSRTKVSHLSSLTTEQAAEPFTVTNKATAQSTDADAPSLLLDFGREVAGRLLVESASPADATLSIAYGESEVKRLRPDSPLGSRAGITSV